MARTRIYMTVKGVNGRMSAPGLGGPKPWMIPVTLLSFELPVPHAMGTGQSGRPARSMTILKAVDAASPLLMKAVISSETLDSVVFEFLDAAHTDSTRVLGTITLTQAKIVQLRRMQPYSGSGSEPHEEIRLAFEVSTTKGSPWGHG